MSYKVSLASARAKWERAEVHRNALEHNLDALALDETQRIVLRAEKDPKTGYHVFRITSLPDLDPILHRVGLAVGDIVHNLRGCLDHITWQLACQKHGGTPPKPARVQFPIGSTVTDLNQRPVRRDLAGAHWDLMEGFQPYHGIGGRPDSWSGAYVHQLTLLKDLANHDKHRALNTVLLIPAGIQIEMSDLPGVSLVPFEVEVHGYRVPRLFDRRAAGQVVELDLEVARAKLTGPGVKDRFDHAGQVLPQVALAEWRPVVPTMERLSLYVELILREFERLFP